MTTEDDFQAALDANPDDHVTRLVFADWLEERGDPRAEGYRALGVTRSYPDMGYERRYIHSPSDERNPWPVCRYDHSTLPSDWWKAAVNAGGVECDNPFLLATRRAAEDAAALAFARLPAERRAELLAQPVA